ncbi:hypothetical protein ARMSODRAFT_665947 [Armillaria solidipes]|uniref:Uncharacterized protein n=1 Tax=Armillaria solidipes TaxID=1076256 RepID=A0A2H3B613_9AGAR|nr:hypothetical protein ARMSODRAFT_665947 [Armillaria solidipes]
MNHHKKSLSRASLRLSTSSPRDTTCTADEPGKQGKWKDEKTLPYNLLSVPKRAFISAGTTKTHFVFAKGCYDRQAYASQAPAERSDFIREKFLINLRYLVSNWPWTLFRKDKKDEGA